MQATIAALLLVAVGSALSQSRDLSSAYQFNASLHNDYTLYWSFDNNAQTISFAVRVRTTGWVGFGLSPNGQMPQSDVVIGWVDGSGNNFDDRFAEGRYLPPVDDHQDWFLLRAEEESGYTTLEFNRNYTSCDTKDRNIKHETARIIWSWNDNDPVNGVFMRHQSMGVTSLNLLGGQANPPQDPPDAQIVTVTVNNITIPNDDTTYWCAAYRIPTTFDTQVGYVTKFTSVITPGNEPYVHHLLIYVCNGLDGVDLSQQGPCYSADNRIQNCLGGTLIGAWAVGGEEFVYPSNLAYPVGGPGYPRYAVMEIHYNNPSMTAGVRDSSGLIFTYTRTRREHNAGIMQVGHQVSFRQIIPPNAQNYSTYGVCHSSCTEQNLPAEGIHVIGNLLHTHTIGTGLELSLLRPNNRLGNNCFQEVQIVERNLNYDFNYQQFVYLPREITIMRGDTLLLRCIYRSAGARTEITVGGLSTQDEMCLSFMVYYPSVDLSICRSNPQFNDFSNFVNNYVPPNLQESFRTVTPNLPLTQLKQIFNQLEWTPEQIQGLENTVYTAGLQVDQCITTDSSDSQVNSLAPQICQPYTEPTICDRDLPGSAGSMHGHIAVLVTLVLIALVMAVV